MAGDIYGSASHSGSGTTIATSWGETDRRCERIRHAEMVCKSDGAESREGHTMRRRESHTKMNLISHSHAHTHHEDAS